MTWTSATSTHLPILRETFPDTAMLKPGEVAKAIRRERQTVYNQVSQGTFPVKVTPTGKKGWLCSIVDLARYLDTGKPYNPDEEAAAAAAAANPAAPVKKKRGPGRPRNPHFIVQYQQEFWSEVVSIMQAEDAALERAELAAAMGDRPLPSLKSRRLVD